MGRGGLGAMGVREVVEVDASPSEGCGAMVNTARPRGSCIFRCSRCPLYSGRVAQEVERERSVREEERER